ncbi:cytochrome P450 2B5-like isoform X2 [Lineus longissimus]|uniref:cytochrome P450 2B5-like isoform X2 n=1 Tax=Lineus longissimus TaxID=88925 RepID=UPI00315C9ED2
MSPSDTHFDWISSIHLTTALIYLFILLVVFTVTKRWLFIDGHLPGPPSIPLLGNLYVIFFNPSNFVIVLTKLSRIYGSVYSFRMGEVPAIVVCGYDSVKEVLVTKAKAFSERPLLGYMKDHPECLGIFFQNGERWSYLRKLTLRAIHDLDTVKPENIRRYISEEMQELVGFIKAKKGRPFDPRDIMASVSANTMCSVMLNRRFDYTDKRIKELIQTVDRMFEIEGFGQMEHFIPALRFLKHIGIGTSFEDEIIRLRKEVKEFILREDTSSFLGGDGDHEVESLAHAYRKRVDHDSDAAITESLTDFIAANTSVGTVFSWLLICCVRYPLTVQRCTEEMHKVFGDGPVDCLVKEDQLPYCTATINEVMRISSAIPTAAPHMASEDTTLNGYPIEKGTLVLVNLHSVHNEREYWGDPDVFRPGRFLDEEGKFNRKERNLSFGAGPRGCLGKQIAKKMIFSFFVTMLTNFDISIPSGDAPPSLQGVLKIVYEPKPFRIVAVAR